MSNRTVGRALLGLGALTTAAMLALGGIATTALAQETDPPAPPSTSASPPPTETTTPPPPTSEPPLPPSEPPAPTSQPAPPSTTAPPARTEAVAQTGNVNAVVFADANRNGTLDLGEALKDAKVSLLDSRGDHTKFTDVSGRASLTGIPVGRYRLYYELPDGWKAHIPSGGAHVTVEANQTAELTVPGQRPYAELFTATASFDQAGYAYPATARITVTLTNTGGHPITGIQADCTQTGVGHHLGHGPEWDVLRGGGVTLAVGEQRTIVINETVPVGARDWGEALLLCNFAPDAADNYGVSVSARVKVTGGKGGKTMVLVDDKNKNREFDDGEAISGTTVTLRDPVSGTDVASVVSGSDGVVAFKDVPVGSYHAVPSSPWSFTVGGAPYEVYVYAPGSTTTYFMYPAPTSKAALRTTLEFDKPNYQSHETMRMKFTITNAGEQAAERVRLPWALIGNPREDITDYGPLKPGGPGLRLEPGETRTVVAVSPINDWRPEPQTLKLEHYLEYAGRKDNREDWFSGSTTITFVVGDVRGVLYGDKNHNGQQDPGEALAGAEVRISRAVPRYAATRVTDAEGRFVFEDAPGGRWVLNYTIYGWKVPDSDTSVRSVLVTPAGVDLSVRAERSTAAVLQATTTFDKASYEPGESARLTVKLTNTGDRPIAGITAACWVYDKSYLGVGPKWGDLAPAAGGVTVDIGETKTITVVEEVPQGALQFGEVQVYCRFGPDVDRNYDLPVGRAWASVPGGFGSVNVRLYHDKNQNYRVDEGEGVPNVRMVLRNWFGNAVVADGVPDANGQLTIPRVPAGPYKASIDGKWKYSDSSQGEIKVVGGGGMSRDIRLEPDETKEPWPPTPGEPGEPGEPGAPHNPAAPTAPTGPAGPAQPTPKVVLAKTGASLLGIGLAGALLVAFGLGARIASRNREAQARGRA
ncbi:hypothetical protein ACIA8G_15815 [Lentzea sp. NPDC051213]|uniref:hypothetical protein n=1 Tax=Lentzea sp. NPDC051213 TaxID=3364126 RepID=UPI00379DB148